MLSLRVAQTLLISALALSACGPQTKPYSPQSDGQRTIFMPSVRTVGPEPVYARTRWVRPPELVPQRDIPGEANAGIGDSPSLRPVFQLSLKDATLEETARVLAATARYSSFTSPSIAADKISVKNIGTIDELARIIESKARVQVVVDHENRDVRFLAVHTEQPRLFDE